MNSSDVNIFAQIPGKSFLITGADGFLGSELVNFLLAQGARVYGQVRSLDTLKRLSVDTDGLTLIPLNFCQPDIDTFKAKLPEGIDCIIHAAAAGVRPNENTWDVLSKVNINGTQLMLETAVAKKAKRFIYIGSSFEYGDGDLWDESAVLRPRTLYGVSKTAGWMLTKCYAETYQIPVVGFRPFYMYGPTEGKTRLISVVIHSAIEKQAIPMTLGEQERDFVYIDDVVRALLYGAFELKALGEMFNICTSESISIRRAVGIMEEETTQVFPLIWGKLPYRTMEWVRLSGSGNKAKQLLGFSTRVRLREGLKKTYEHYVVKK